MIDRYLKKKLIKSLAEQPAVVLLGARQVGKTTLAQEILKSFSTIYIDLEDYIERDGVMQNPRLFCEQHKDKLIIFDEIQNTPALFPVLHGVIDQRRREGKENNLFLLLGSASLELTKQASESLAGRVSYLDMTTLVCTEVGKKQVETLWSRGGVRVVISQILIKSVFKIEKILFVVTWTRISLFLIVLFHRKP